MFGPWPSGCRRGGAPGAELSNEKARRASQPRPTGPPGPRLPASGPSMVPGHTRAAWALRAHSPHEQTQGPCEQDTGALFHGHAHRLLLLTALTGVLCPLRGQCPPDAPAICHTSQLLTICGGHVGVTRAQALSPATDSAAGVRRLHPM